jgi:hypothetical protein
MALNLQNLPKQNSNPLQHIPASPPRITKGWKHSLFKLIGATITGIMVFSTYNVYITLNPANFGDRSGPSNLKASLNTLIEKPTPTIVSSSSSEAVSLDNIITTDSIPREEPTISSSSTAISSEATSSESTIATNLPDTLNIQNIGSNESTASTSFNPIYLNIRVDKPEITAGEELLIQSYPPVESDLNISFHISHENNDFTTQTQCCDRYQRICNQKN